MYSTKALIVAAISAATAVAAAPNNHRGAAYIARSLYERDAYPVAETANPPSCAADYDTYDMSTGQCECGPGRVQFTNGTCAVANGGGNYQVYELSSPQPVSISITWSDVYSGPGDVMNAAQCGGIASTLGGAIGYYLEPADASSTAYCWVLGGPYIFDSPITSPPLPFTPSSSSKKRSSNAGSSGTIGAAGGQLAFQNQSTDPSSGSSTTGCQSSLGDTATSSGTCACGAGRVNNGPDSCTYPASGTTRMRRSTRDTYAGVQW